MCVLAFWAAANSDCQTAMEEEGIGIIIFKPRQVYFTAIRSDPKQNETKIRHL